MTRTDRIRSALDTLQGAGIVRNYYCQSGMPGRHWTVDIPGYGRTFTTAEVEAFIVGTTAAMAAPRWQA